MQPQTIIQPNKYIPQLDGLRGIAIIMVMCYHYFPGSLICNFGWSGVDLFFVLSGFLITGRLLPFLQDKKLLQKFYRNRILRIVPLYYTFLVIFFLCWFIFTSTTTRNTTPFYSVHGWQFFLFIQNWVFIDQSLAIKTHLQHFWSIAVEEQIYIFFPLLLIVFKNKKKIFYTVILIFSIVLVARCIYYLLFFHNTIYDEIFWNSFFRLDAFLAGVAVYLIANNYNKKMFHRLLQWTGLACFLVLLTHIISTNNAEKNNLFITTAGYTLIAVMYAGLLLTVLLKNNRAILFISSLGFLKYTGKISYGLYILHWPIYIAGFAVWNKLFTALHINTSQQTLEWVNTCCSILSSYLLAHFSFTYFESIFLKWKIKPV